MSSRYEETFHKFYVPLVMTLPMNDTIFVAKMYSLKLLSADLKYSLWQVPTPSDKASLFLDSVIGQSLAAGYNDQFDMLLKCMREYDIVPVVRLAQEISADLEG